MVVLAAARVDTRLAGVKGSRAGVDVDVGRRRGKGGDGEEDGGDGLHFGLCL